MRRFLIAVAPLIAFAFASSAAAAPMRGTVVSADRAHKLLAVADVRGYVLLLHTNAAVRPGVRVSVNATKLRDGSYNATALRRTGTAKQARVRGLVVRSAGSKLILSVHGALLAVQKARTVKRQGHSLSGSEPQFSDVQATVAFSDGQPTLVSEQEIDQQANAGAFDGTVVSVGNGQLLLSADGQQLTLTLPSWFSTVTLTPGERLLVYFSLGADGSYTVTALGNDTTAATADDPAEVAGDVEQSDRTVASDEEGHQQPTAGVDVAKQQLNDLQTSILSLFQRLSDSCAAKVKAATTASEVQAAVSDCQSQLSDLKDQLGQYYSDATDLADNGLTGDQQTEIADQADRAHAQFDTSAASDEQQASDDEQQAESDHSSHDGSSGSGEHSSSGDSGSVPGNHNGDGSSSSGSSGSGSDSSGSDSSGSDG